jgi:WD40 repeat protein
VTTVRRERVRGALRAGLRPGGVRRPTTPGPETGPAQDGPEPHPGGPDRRPFVVVTLIGLVLATVIAGMLAWRAAGDAEDNLAARGFRGEISAERAFRTVAFAPDGTQIFAATGSVVEVWHLTTRRRVGQPFAGHDGTVTALAVSPSGRLLATTADDGTARIWDVTTRAQAGDPIDTGDVARPSALAFSPDGSLLALAGDGGTALWDTGARRLVGILASASGAHAAVAFSPDGVRVAAGEINGGTISLWDVTTRLPDGEPFSGHGGNGPVSALAFDRSGTWLADGSSDKASFVYNTVSREQTEFRQNEEPVHTVILNDDATRLITASIQDVIIWDVQGVAQISRPIAPDGSADVNDVALGPDGDTLAVIRDHRIQFWSLAAVSRR